MKIKLHEIPVKDIFNGYKDLGEDEGVVGYGGKLNIRPKYQRNFVYDLDQEQAVMDTVLHDFPLNVMYWVVTKDGYEVLDGQQRTLSIMQYLDHKFMIDVDGNQLYANGLPDDLYDRVMNYKLMVYFCEGTTSEKLSWFKTVNIAGLKLTSQELRNIAYTGPWLSSAKTYFSKRGCVAKKMADPYVKGDPNRQEILELALSWISDSQNMTIEEYMAKHREDEDAGELWMYWKKVIGWIRDTFSDVERQMKGLPWGEYYNKYKDNDYNSIKISDDVHKLLDDPEVTSKRGIWLYELTKDIEPNAIKHLSLRTFDQRDIKRKYDEQTKEAEEQGVSNCPYCAKEHLDKIWKQSEMDADHIVPWSKGGVTEYSNLQMLCKKHNRSKGNH